jgi:hypothetical protein
MKVAKILIRWPYYTPIQFLILVYFYFYFSSTLFFLCVEFLLFCSVRIFVFAFVPFLIFLLLLFLPATGKRLYEVRPIHVFHCNPRHSVLTILLCLLSFLFFFFSNCCHNFKKREILPIIQLSFLFPNFIFSFCFYTIISFFFPLTPAFFNHCIVE